ncbi:MAG TPA: riboflavin synthase [Thermoanaerobaculia bacterium]|jgi:riboflavin synthase|nr:riboflavin synthase [Thermoanaerobaculia bacterium]
MFSGLILETGRVADDPEPMPGGGCRLGVDLSAGLAARLPSPPLGASLAVSGVCLTIVALDPISPSAFRATFELSPETLARTTLAALRAGAEVNLEPALRVGDPLGGHWVQGHVDGIATVVDRREQDEFRILAFSLPEALERYLVEKGSVTVEGVSLTVSALAADRFEVALVPHTLALTTLSRLAAGDRVNLEVDVLAKYVERALAAREGRASLDDAGVDPFAAALPAGAWV